MEDDQPHRPKAILSQLPLFTIDDCFSGDCVVVRAKEEGTELTMTCRRDRPPKGILSKCTCKLTVNSTSRAKASRSENPIFLSKAVEGTKSVCQFATFQSTSSCDVTCVNFLSEHQLLSVAKERGRDAHKRQWGIEVSESRQLCLGSRETIDTVDHMVKHCDQFRGSWKH